MSGCVSFDDFDWVFLTKLPGEMGFPGTEYGQLNCVTLASNKKITIPKEAIAKLLGSPNIKSFYTRLVRGNLPPAEDELRRLRAEVARLRAERDLLKKAAAYFASPPS